MCPSRWPAVGVVLAAFVSPIRSPGTPSVDGAALTAGGTDGPASTGERGLNG